MGTSKPQGHPLPSEWSFLSTSHNKSIPCTKQMVITLQNSPSSNDHHTSESEISHFKHSFYPNNSHFPLLSTLYSSTGICNKWKISKSSEKHYIILLLKNHCFSHFFTFLHLFGIFPNSPRSPNFTKT